MGAAAQLASGVYVASNRDPVLSAEKAAEYMGVDFFTERTLKRWRKESTELGVLKGPKWVELESGRIGYRQSALDQYLQEREAKPEKGSFRA